MEAHGSVLFRNAFLNSLTKTNTRFAICLYGILITIYTFFIWSGIPHLHLFGKMIAILGGLMFFTLIEYLIHRFIYHSGEYLNPGSWQYKIHGIHHDQPRDHSRIAMPVPLALFLAGIFLLIFWLLMGNGGLYFFTGFFTGYILYLSAHYLVHARRPPKNFFKYWWIHHHLHHHKYDHKAFGVSSPFWDWIFKTMPPSNTTQKS